MSTWTHDNGACWIKWLASKRPDARIFSFGYDAQKVYLLNQNAQGHRKGRTFAYAENLCVALTDEEGWLDKKLPLTFIGHGVGGLVIKNALILSSARRAVYGEILERTKHVMFMDTPHRGLNTDLWHSVYGSTATEEAQRQFHLWNEGLSDIGTYFAGIYSKFAITSVYATEPITVYGKPLYEVDELSSGLFVENEKRISLSNTTHISMCKYECDTDHNYRSVLRRILAELRAAELVEEKSKVSQLRQNNSQIITWIQPSERSREDQRQLHDKAIGDYCPGTGAWLRKSEHYKKWLNGETRLAWVRGPGEFITKQSLYHLM